MENCIEITGLCKNFKTFALKDVNFRVEKGTIMGLIGANGAGKTTTLRLLLGAIQPDGGRALVFGKELKAGTQAHDEIGVVFDEMFFHDNLTPNWVGKVMAGIYSKWDDREYHKLIDEFGLPGKKKIKEFSRGMKMKLSMAVALSHHAKLLVLDEPTSGLDPVVRDEILDLLRRFVEDEENTVILSTHITSDLEKVADTITMLKEGEVVFTSPKDDLVDEYRLVKGSNEEYAALNHGDFVGLRKNSFGFEGLAPTKTVKETYPTLLSVRPTIEEIMLFFVKGEQGE